MFITRVSTLCFVLVLSFALIQSSHQATTSSRQTIPRANSLLMGLNYTGKINVDSYGVNSGALVNSQKSIYYALPGVSTLSVRPRSIGYDATRGLTTLVGEHDKVIDVGGRQVKVRVNFLFFFDAQNASRKTGIEPFREVYWDARYDGTIYSYASLTRQESMDSIFYWTKACTLNASEMASPLFYCRHKVTGDTYRSIPALYLFNWNGGRSSEVDPPTLRRVPIELDSDSMNLNLVAGVFATSVVRDASVPEEQRFNNFIQLARGVSGSKEPSDKSFVILNYSHTWVSAVNLGRNYTITRLAVGERTILGAVFFMLGYHNKQKQWYLLKIYEVECNRHSARMSEPEVVLNLSAYDNVDHLHYEYMTKQLMFLATHRSSGQRYLVYVDVHDLGRVQIVKSVPPAQFNYQAMYINKGA